MDPMEAIKQTFFQECEELLLAMEEGLLAIERSEFDNETVNAVFRAVHSIKGGAGAFGFDRLVAFSHVFETVLDKLRTGVSFRYHNSRRLFAAEATPQARKTPRHPKASSNAVTTGSPMAMPICAPLNQNAWMRPCSLRANQRPTYLLHTGQRPPSARPSAKRAQYISVSVPAHAHHSDVSAQPTTPITADLRAPMRSTTNPQIMSEIR